jgi:membrane-associated PAP2 superfamily phosphatase
VNKHKRWLLPLLFVVLLAPLTPWLDLSIAHYFYDAGKDSAAHFMTAPWIDFMYHWGVWIPNLFAILAVPFLFFKKWRKPALVITLTAIVGSGLIAHGILKDYWGRPRPKQVEMFGGTQEYRPFWRPNFHPPEPSRSFVCGHCSIGFLFLTLVILGLRKASKPLYWTGIALSTIFGGGLGLARMAAGGHFFSDVLFAALLLWWTSLSMDWLVWADENTH